MYTTRQLKQILSSRRLYPKKKWGQNFLIDKNIRNKIIEAAHLSKNDIVLEIGPGLGALTDRLAQCAKKVIAIEKDKRLCGILNEVLEQYKNIELILGDILKFNIRSWVMGHGLKLDKIKVIGNLPYYITTPIITHLLEQKSAIHSILITVQKEVAERLMAGPGTGNYGAISVFVQFHTQARIIRHIKSTAFFPKPDVDSSLIHLDVLEHPRVEVASEEIFFKIVRTAFSKRRKTILTSLSAGGYNRKHLSSILEEVNIDPKRRPETLSLNDFARLANRL